jgi:hypothetical protein
MILVFVLLYIGICFKWGAWRRWREFYPTILYVIIGDLAYNFVFHDYSLWAYSGLFNHTTSDLIIAFCVFPSMVILFLTHWPQGYLKQALYVIAWATVHTLIEGLSILIGNFCYTNGWCIIYSFLFLIIAFLLIKLHYSHPLIVWPISAALAVLVMLIFRLPFETIK